MPEIYRCKLGAVVVKNAGGGLLAIDVIDRFGNKSYTIDDGTPKTLALLKKRLQCFDPSRPSMKVSDSRAVHIEESPAIRPRSSEPSRDVFSEMMDQREKLVQLISSNAGKKRR